MGRFTTVIFDFGGVITASPFEAFNRLEEERGLPRDYPMPILSVFLMSAVKRTGITLSWNTLPAKH